MKILVISSHYPPCHSGGYELRVKNIFDQLWQRGFDVQVLTSKTGDGRLAQTDSGYPILRKLHSKTGMKTLIDWFTAHRISHYFGLLLAVSQSILFDIFDLKIVDKEISNFQPDIIYLGQILPLTTTLLPFLARVKKPIIVDDGGGTLVTLNEDHGTWFKFCATNLKYPLLNSVKESIIKLFLLLSSNRLETHWIWPGNLQVMFKREINYQKAAFQKIPFVSSMILRSGIDVDLFKFLHRDKITDPIVFIIPARIEPRKGQIDAVRLITNLKDEGIRADLILVGEPRKSYLIEVLREAKLSSVEENLTILPMVDHAELVELYHHADICFFPSYWRDGLSRVPMEAMACGTIVVSYGNEGSSEIIRNNENGFLIEQQDYKAIVGIIKELLDQPKKYLKIIQQARKDIQALFSLNEYVDEVEKIIISASTRALDDQSPRLGPH